MRVRILNPRRIAPQIHPHRVPDAEPKVRDALGLGERLVRPRNVARRADVEARVDRVPPRGQDGHVLERGIDAEGLPAAEDLRAALAALERLRPRHGLAAGAEVLRLAARGDREEELAGGGLGGRGSGGAEGGAAECVSVANFR